MSGFRKKSACVGLVLAFCICTAVGAVAAADVSGTWDLVVETPQGKGTPYITVRQQDGKLSGRYYGRMGESALEGTLRDNRIQFSVTLRFQDQSFTVTYSGTVEGDAMRGTAQFGDSGSGTWTAKRRP